ncbi:M15 family metallopeptidase [Cellulomonas sp. Leaf334]|uniref:M15 family metallopeptidase n=1 Tax=Cellulomonas sp. Leaf334 TaxID=1736339 RepID=UPI0006FEF8E9|nr:M15 family metallopeptidase [Cellulomonas sp. Leaf334]KQR08280.1 peptidase M15 [Cellulomonas sp. Leaf334]
MSSSTRTRSAVVALAFAGVVAAGVGLLDDGPSAAPRGQAAVPPPPPSAVAPVDDPGQLGADGSVPDGVTVFDDDVPAVTNLDGALLDALRRAATDATGDGVAFVVNSGWRSAEYQDRLLQDAVVQYGSAQEAARWVATAETSPHVRGDAVDVGPWAATAWLSEHGAGYGLCQVYGNEPWHYELRPDAVGAGCPAMYPDPTHDPRMAQ